MDGAITIFYMKNYFKKGMPPSFFIKNA